MNNKITVEKENIYYASLLLLDYADEQSEETSLHQYFYQSIILKDKNIELSNDLMKISKDEMMHSHTLGTLIYKLGLKPLFISQNTFTNNYIPWDTNNINYTTNVKKMLESNITLEQNAIKRYKEHLNIIKDINVQKIIKSIINDEIRHLNIFIDHYKKLKR